MNNNLNNHPEGIFIVSLKVINYTDNVLAYTFYYPSICLHSLSSFLAKRIIHPYNSLFKEGDF